MGGSFTDPALFESNTDVSNMDDCFHSQPPGSSSQRGTARVSKEAYKQASSLFLTRRLTEALSTLEPIIVAPLAEDNGERSELAPIASASRSSRIKIWSLYLTLLNAIIDLGPEDGKAAFGSNIWRDIVNKVRAGTIWDEIVQVGYKGVEGKVDDEVVINLATILLSHSPNQTINQQRLESYLSSASDQPRLDIKDRIRAPIGIKGIIDGSNHCKNGTITPRDLTSRIKILELYSLHILPCNGEWAYAKEFINMSEVLPKEKRDAFLEALQSLEANDMEALRKLEVEKSKELEKLQHLEVEKSKDRNHEEQPPVSINSRKPSHLPRRTAKAGKELQPNIRSRPATSSKRPNNTGIYNRGVIIINALQILLSNLTHSLSKNSMWVLRFVLFLVALIVALSRRDVKERVGRIVGFGWEKLRKTVGMGVKVSYI